MSFLSDFLRDSQAILTASIVAIGLGFVLVLIGVMRRNRGQRLAGLSLGLLLVGLGFAALLGCAAAQEEPPVWDHEEQLLAKKVAPPMRDLEPAYTDRGTPITVRIPISHTPSFTMLDAEATYLASHGLSDRVTRLTMPSDETNCHGWVFTGGQSWVSGVDVPRILEDNEYQQVSNPRSGDVIVYFDDAGDVLHTGIVSSVSAEGVITIESKLGKLGRYLHKPETQSYSRNWQFYRSPREGHLLECLPDTPPTPTGPVI